MKLDTPKIDLVVISETDFGTVGIHGQPAGITHARLRRPKKSGRACRVGCCVCLFDEQLNLMAEVVFKAGGVLESVSLSVPMAMGKVWRPMSRKQSKRLFEKFPERWEP